MSNNNSGVVVTRLQEDQDLFSADKIASHGTMPETNARILTASIVCNLSKESDKYKAHEYQPFVKHNFWFIDELYENLNSF